MALTFGTLLSSQGADAQQLHPLGLHRQRLVPPYAVRSTVPPGSRRPGRHGRLVPADLGALHPQDREACGAAGERAVPARGRGLRVLPSPSGPPCSDPLGGVYCSSRTAPAREGIGSAPCGEHPSAAPRWTIARNEAREGRVSARPLLENSTACRKSVPSNTPCRGLRVLVWDSFG